MFVVMRHVEGGEAERKLFAFLPVLKKKSFHFPEYRTQNFAVVGLHNYRCAVKAYTKLDETFAA